MFKELGCFGLSQVGKQVKSGKPPLKLAKLSKENLYAKSVDVYAQTVFGGLQVKVRCTVALTVPRVYVQSQLSGASRVDVARACVSVHAMHEYAL
jgi:hypothetical protein